MADRRDAEGNPASCSSSPEVVRVGSQSAPRPRRASDTQRVFNPSRAQRRPGGGGTVRETALGVGSLGLRPRGLQRGMRCVQRSPCKPTSSAAAAPGSGLADRPVALAVSVPSGGCRHCPRQAAFVLERGPAATLLEEQLPGANGRRRTLRILAGDGNDTETRPSLGPAVAAGIAFGPPGSNVRSLIGANPRTTVGRSCGASVAFAGRAVPRQGFRYAAEVDRAGRMTISGGARIGGARGWSADHLLLALIRCSIDDLTYHAHGHEVAAQGQAQGTITKPKPEAQYAFVSIDVRIEAQLTPRTHRQAAERAASASTCCRAPARRPDGRGHPARRGHRAAAGTAAREPAPGMIAHDAQQPGHHGGASRSVAARFVDHGQEDVLRDILRRRGQPVMCRANR